MDTTTAEIRHLEAPPIESSQEDERTLLGLLTILARRKWFIAKVTIGFGLVVLIISLLMAKSYTAETTVLPPQQNSSLASSIMSQLGSLGSLGALAGAGAGLKNPNDMYIAMFKSRTVEDAMVGRFHLMQRYHQKYMSTGRKAFEGRVKVESGTKDNLIHIAVVDGDPKFAAEMANGYVEEFRNLSQHLAIGEAAQRRLFFEQQLAQAKDNLANAEEALKETQQQTGMLQLDSQARALIETVASLRAQIRAKEVQLQAMKTYATNENADVVQAQKEMDSLKAQLAQLGGSAEDSSSDLILPKGKVTQAGLEYVRKLRDVKYWETIFEILARQFEVAKLDEAKEGALIQVVDPAIVPDYKSGPKRGLMTIVAAFIGFIISTFIVLVQEGLARARQNPEQNVRLTELHRALWGKKTA